MQNEWAVTPSCPEAGSELDAKLSEDRRRASGAAMVTEFERIDQDLIARLSSPYLSGGRLLERWNIQEIEWRAAELRAKVCFTEFFVSPTDSGFHLSNLAGLEIVAQLRIIHVHLLLGLDRKTREVWFVRGSERCIRPIRDPQCIHVGLNTRCGSETDSRRTINMSATLTDRFDGRFEYKALLVM